MWAVTIIGEISVTDDSGRITHHASRITTDPQDELFDVLDAEGRPTGVVKSRGEVHRDGDWHGALQIWVGGIGDDGAPFVLFQRRSLTKDTWPGFLETAISGHIRSGETFEETIREAEEEIGLAVGASDLTFIGRRFIAGSDGVVSEREAHTVFAVRCDQPLSAYRLHPEEVDSLVSVPLETAGRMFAGEIETVDGIECRRDGAASVARLARSEFIILDVEYQLAALPALAAVIDGTTPEPFEVRTMIDNA
jgi:isopentenyldiphosphate isomerase